MRTFKHKKTKWIAETHTCIPRSYRVKAKHNLICMPAELIEDSEDWKEQIEKDYEILNWQGDSWKVKDILSVKRLSDGEVFSVGDMHRSIHIGSLRINKIYEKYGAIWLDHACGATRLDNAEKVARKPILTSEDGVELFEGDKYVAYNAKDDIFMDEIIDEQDPINNWLYFSTREAAEDYRLNHARVLSYNDIQDYYPYMLFPRDSEELKDLIKSRLK